MSFPFPYEYSHSTDLSPGIFLGVANLQYISADLGSLAVARRPHQRYVVGRNRQTTFILILSPLVLRQVGGVGGQWGQCSLVSSAKGHPFRVRALSCCGDGGAQGGHGSVETVPLWIVAVDPCSGYVLRFVPNLELKSDLTCDLKSCVCMANSNICLLHLGMKEGLFMIISDASPCHQPQALVQRTLKS